MSRLDAQLTRLYRLPGDAGQDAPIALVDAAGQTRTLIIVFQRSQDWDHLAGLCDAIQAAFALPPPAVSVAAGHGFALWFSLAEPVAVSRAVQCLEGLRRRFLADLPGAQLCLLPQATPPFGTAPRVPVRDETIDRWSAFIDPGLGAMFRDEAGLEIAPNPDRQADLLAGLKSIPAPDFERLLGELAPTAPSGHFPMPETDSAPASGFTHPRDFLLSVMNDPAHPLADRLRAAEALQPYFS